ncbi:M23 family metallopeptidase [Lentzea jiangxiensis]|uniref:Peptidase family M23 n=1 Tax=Lentzea jiangxiensis TaxID=641025 RepID=A0A1H0X5N1_9PSEU|nr:M23 family metallopeptidase [Lentzea jiangxiensis]SDP98258.1 Peptidase family M23 [Lentzea jiangxiensis]
MKNTKARSIATSLAVAGALTLGVPSSPSAYAKDGSHGNDGVVGMTINLLQHRQKVSGAVVRDALRMAAAHHEQVVRERAAAAAAAAASAAAAAAEAAARAPKYARPANGVLTSGFGARWGTQHRGVDIANSVGTPIRSAADGVVVNAGPAAGFGLWVRVRHADGTITVYGHVDRLLTSTGRSVRAGDQIATMGNRGQSTGPHLHFEVWQNGVRAIDPLSWLQNQGVSI